MCFRYALKPVDSHVTNVFKPNAIGEGEQPDWRHSTIGACFVGNMDKVISNKRASVVWEAFGKKCVFSTSKKYFLQKIVCCANRLTLSLLLADSSR